jgi:hypothetical protein
MKHPAIKCPQCKGTGEIPLSEPLADVLAIVHANPGITASDVYNSCGDWKEVKVTAINNRLVDLERLGFISRVRSGKEFRWSVKNGKEDIPDPD